MITYLIIVLKTTKNLKIYNWKKFYYDKRFKHWKKEKGLLIFRKILKFIVFNGDYKQIKKFNNNKGKYRLNLRE